VQYNAIPGVYGGAGRAEAGQTAPRLVGGEPVHHGYLEGARAQGLRVSLDRVAGEAEEAAHHRLYTGSKFSEWVVARMYLQFDFAIDVGSRWTMEHFLERRPESKKGQQHKISCRMSLC
jgi:hypothetical protein